MQVRKAVITAAAPNQNTLPLQRLVDRHGHPKTALQMIVEDVLAAGVEEIGVVIQPGDSAAYHRAAGENLGCLRFVEQPSPLGYGDALLRARQVVGDEPFLHLVGDHLYLSATSDPCSKQVMDVARENDCTVSAVQANRENKLPYFGVASGSRVARHERLYEVTHVVEKPTPTQAEQELVTAGLRSGHYLCFFGIHVLTPIVLEIIEKLLEKSPGRRVTLSEALNQLVTRQRFLAYQMQGTRFNIGERYGLLIAQLAVGLAGRDRDYILTELVELLATRPETSATS